MINEARVMGEIVNDSLSGINMKINYAGSQYSVRSRLIGSFNCYNILASFCAGISMGLDAETVIEGIEAVEGVRGRLERVTENIFVDFAHTPRALENVLLTLKKYTKGRVIVIFGCGGDRDKTKRPEMGRVAAHLADFVILTSDNPRSEDPGKIIADISEGIPGNNYTVIEDRREAIRYGIHYKKEDDILLIAGKGHEEYQIFKDRIIEFNDVEVVKECLKEISYV